MKRRPLFMSYQVVSQELHDQCGVLVALLAEGIEFCRLTLVNWDFYGSTQIKLTSDSIIESLLGEMAGLVGRVQDLVVENGEVKGKTKADWVCWRKVGLSNFGCVLVSLKRLVGRLLSLVANGELGKVTVVVTLPVNC